MRDCEKITNFNINKHDTNVLNEQIVSNINGLKIVHYTIGTTTYDFLIDGQKNMLNT